MGASVSEQCRTCITILKTIVSTLSDPNKHKGRIHHEQVNDELERFSLWIGNIGAMHFPESPMSLESRLCEANDISTHVLELLNDLNEVTGELLEIVSGKREGGVVSMPQYDDGEEDQNEETELLEDIGACITRLFRVSNLIRQAAPTDLFAKALSRNRYRFNDQYDIAHVGEKYPKLAGEECAWLQKRLGRAITQRRHYLSYIQDHREKLKGMLTHEERPELVAPRSQALTKQLPAMKLHDSFSRPSTFFTKASSLTPGQITPQMLTAEEESDPENDARSYTTISRSVDGGLDSSATVRIPKLDELRIGPKKEVDCPFCFQIKRFKNERVWRRHVFSDLRSYVCTFPNCDAPYFGNINEWFRHEMQSHRISYTCQLCQSKTFQLRERYLAHVRKTHPNMLEDGEEQHVLDIARKPLNQIPAQECPCCSEWIDRLKERAVVASMPYDTSEHTLNVDPTIFKRHLASHLEQLALFAIPIGPAAGDDVNSNAAIEEDVGALPGGSGLSTLAFDSSGPSSPASKGPSPGDVLVTEGVVEATAGNEESEREETTLLLYRRGADIPITEEVNNAAARGDLEEAIRVGSKRSRSRDSARSAATSSINTPFLTPLASAPSLLIATGDAASDNDDLTPYPAFLRLSRLEIHQKFIDFEWEQRKRLQGIQHQQNEPKQGSLWARCTGEDVRIRNRYPNVDPYQNNRVRLKVPEGANDYINASPVELTTTMSKTVLKYIATQGPKSDTTPHFWRMVWHETSPAVIVMLTQTHESGREKCFPYFPRSLDAPDMEINSCDEYGDGFVHHLKLANLEDHEEARAQVRELDLTPTTEDASESRKIWHLLFAAWPDFHVPEGDDRMALLKLIELSREKNSDNSTNPRIIHCSAGVGRTGTFIALDWLLQELEEGSLDEVEDEDDPISTVIGTLRQQRMMMVQGEAQLALIYDVLREQWRNRWIKLRLEEAERLGVTRNGLEEPKLKGRKSEGS